MRVTAHLQSGRMVACAYQKARTAHKYRPLTYLWHDTRDCGGVYEQLEKWMRIICMEQSEPVRFILEEYR